MNLKESRKATNLTQMQLAEMLKVSQGQLSQWETGTARPSYHQQEKMDKILTFQVNWAQEFDALDFTEQNAALRFAAYLAAEVSEDAAARLVFRNSKYNVRQMLKSAGYLPKDYRSGDDLLLPRA